MYMRLSIFFIVFLFFHLVTWGQKYGDPNFYLTDSLDLELIEALELKRLDSTLNLYHNCDKTNDTLPLYYLEQLVQGYESANIEGLYRYEYLKYTKKIDLKIIKNPIVKKRINFAKGYAYANVGIMLVFNGSQDTALAYVEKAIPYFSKTDSSNYKALAYSLASYCCKNLGKINEAIDYNMDALALAEKSDDKEVVCSVYNNLAGLHQLLENFSKSEYFYQQVLVNTKNDDTLNYGVGLVNYAELLYDDLNDIVKAKQLLLESQSFIDTSNGSYQSKAHAINVYSVLSKIYLTEKKYSQSEDYYLKSLALSKSINIDARQCEAYLGLAEVSLINGQFKKAKINGELALNIAKENSLLKEVSLAYKVLSKVHNKLNNHEKAFEYLEKHLESKESYKQAEDKKKLLQRAFKYDYDKKVIVDSLKNQEKLNVANANELLANEKAENSKAISFLSVAIVLVTLILLWFIYSKMKVIRKQKKALDIAFEQLEESKKNELAISNLKAIKSQMNPHFMFNSLNSIQHLILKEDIENSYDYIVMFSELVRSTLTYSEKEFIEIEKELKFLKVYLELEKLRFKDDFEYNINSNLPTSVKVPSILIQPFIENALKHGLLHKTGLKKLTVELKLSDKLTCIIKDNGVGRKKSSEIKAAKNKEHESFAMGSITKRLAILSDRYNKVFSYEVLDLYDENGVAQGTEVHLNMPFEKTI